MAELQKSCFKASSLLSVCVVVLVLWLSIPARTSMAATRTVRVGVILDLNSTLGYMLNSSLAVAVEDYYELYHEDANTKIDLVVRNVDWNDVVAADDEARDLINNEKVRAILGPQDSEQARFVVELGNKYDVPVIWFSSSGPSLLPPRSRFFIHSNSTTSLCYQFKAIAAIIEAYGWQCVIPIYEEPEFGYDLIPCLTYALQEMDTRMPNISRIRPDSSTDDMKKELNNIKDHGTCVLLAHMTVELWKKISKQAKEEKMMSKGYAWILTQGLSPVIDTEARDIKEGGYMDGVLGVTPSLVASPTSGFYNTTKRISLARKLWSEYNKTLSLYCLWAYDTITALANAVENADLVDSDESIMDLREAINNTDFLGLSGNFSLRQGQLEPSGFVVYNVKNKAYEIVGYWGPETGLALNDRVEIEWPGKAEEIPPRLKIGIPKAHFPEFANVSGEGTTGFAVDVFNKVVHVLPFNLTYYFVPVNLSNYEYLLCNSTDKDYVDIIIGDITIVVNRTDCADFTMPYLDSSVSMVVKVRSDSKNGWILLKPFHWLLWLVLSVIFVVATAIVIILECNMEGNGFKDFVHNPFVHNPFLIYLSDVLSLKRGTSKWVVIVVMFVLSIAVQIYTANLTSILSERTTAKPSHWKDVQEIKRKNVKVGYQNDSWVRGLLVHQIGLRKDQLKPLGGLTDYMEKLSKGAKNGGVDAIIDETPYLMLLRSGCSDCEMTGPIYKTGGFAFAFKKNSTLVSNFSTAILNVTQNVTIFRDMKKNISLPDDIDKSEYKSEVETRGLTKDDFGGLFPIVYSLLALFFAISILKLPNIDRWLRSTRIYHWFQNHFAECL